MKILIIFPILISLYLINFEPLYSGSFADNNIKITRENEIKDTAFNGNTVKVKLTGYKYYYGTINFIKAEIIISEDKTNIRYANIENLFEYQKKADKTAMFFLEAAILEIPKDLISLSENRNNLDKKILKIISKLKYNENIDKYFNYKEIYNNNKRAVLQFNFDFNLDRSTITYFILLNNRNGKWQVEEISKEKPFLLK